MEMTGRLVTVWDARGRFESASFHVLAPAALSPLISTSRDCAPHGAHTHDTASPRKVITPANKSDRQRTPYASRTSTHARTIPILG
jgi:hypothetical protein